MWAIARLPLPPHTCPRSGHGAGKGSEADTGLGGVARQATPRAAAGLVEELKAEREQKREHELDKRFGVAQERSGGRLIMKIDGERAVVVCRFGGMSPVSSPGQRPLARMRHREGNVLKDQA